MPHTQADETACLGAGGAVDGLSNECCFGDNCTPLEGYANANNPTNSDGNSNWLQYVNPFTSSFLDILSFFGIGGGGSTPQPINQQSNTSKYAPWIILGVLVIITIVVILVLKKKK